MISAIEDLTISPTLILIRFQTTLSFVMFCYHNKRVLCCCNLSHIYSGGGCLLVHHYFCGIRYLGILSCCRIWHLVI